MRNWLLGSAIASILLGFPAIAIPPTTLLTQATEARKTEADRLYNLGLQQAQSSQFREALQSWESALQIYREIGDRTGEARTLGNQGNVSRSLGDYSRSRELYDRSLSIFREIGDRAGEGSSLLGLALGYQSTQENDRAIELYQQALTIAREVGDRIREGAILNNLGNIYRLSGDNTKAVEFYQQSLPIFRETGYRVGEASTLTNLGNIHQFWGQNEKAIEFYQQSLAISREIGNRFEESNATIGLGNSFLILGNYEAASEYLQQALAIKREIGDRAGESYALSNLGNIHNLLGESNKAIEFYQQAVTTLQAIGDRSGESNALVGLGNAYRTTGQIARAIETYQRALAIVQVIGDRSGESNALNQLGEAYNALGDYAEAISLYERSLAIAREIGGRAQAGSVLINLGSIYYTLGQYARAVELYGLSLTIAREIKDPTAESNTLIGLGSVYYLLNEYSQAIEVYQQALAIKQQLGDRSGEGTNLANLGLAYQSRGESAKAKEFYEKSLDIFRELGDRNREGNASIGLGYIYQTLGEETRALKLYQDSLNIFREIGSRDREGRSLHAIAHVQQQQGNFKEARENIEASIAISESIRAGLENPDLRQSFFATLSDRYRLYINILMQLHRENPDRGYDAQALHASEKSRARTLTEILTEARLNVRQNIDPQLLVQERELIQEISQLERERGRLLGGSYANQDLNRLNQRRDRGLQALSDLETRIRRNHPAYADLKYPQPLTLPEIQRDILDEETLLLEYALESDRSYLFVVGKNEFSTYELPPKEEIEAAVEKYVTALQAEDRNPLAEGKDLAQMLLSPIANKLKGQRLAIVADGKLHRLPFGALPWEIENSLHKNLTTKPQSDRHLLAQNSGAMLAPLLANHEIIHLSSASSLAIQRQQMQNRPRAAKKVAVFADPVFSKRDSRLTGDVDGVASVAAANPLLELFRDGCRSLDRLPYTRTEAENILSLVPDDQKFLAMGFAADRAAATSENLAQYEILHLSTHGCIQDNPQLSGLALSLYDENGTQQDGFLRLQDIYNLQLNADLVVLSACQTGIGEEISGEGVVGLTRGFMYAGARRVTVSLWNVSDRATADLMSEYYQKMLSEGKSPATALREAQLQMWREGELPYKWAAFIMQGDWQ